MIHAPLYAQDVNIDDVSGETLFLTDFPDGVINLYDSGGPFGVYQDFEDYEVTICSDFQLAGCPPPPTINCIFQFIDIEPNITCAYDWMQIDNSPVYCNDNYPPLYGTTAISYQENESGCMTVRFHSDLSYTYEGFMLTFVADHPDYYDPDPLECGDVRQGEIYWALHGCPSCLDYYDCGNNTYGPYWGAESQYDIYAEGPVTLTVEGDVDFFVYGSFGVGPNGCPPITLIACATGNQTTVSFDADEYPNGIWVIVDGEIGYFDISLECNPCDPDPIDCGQIIHDFLNQGGDAMDTYDCVGPEYPYQELVYAFTPETSGFYTFYTYGFGGVAPAIILRDCCGGGGPLPQLQQSECEICEHAWNPNGSFNALEVFLFAGETYYIFIEKATNPNINEFQFWIDCDEPLDCDQAPPVSCGELVTGDNSFSSGASNHNIDYCGYESNYWTGNEVVYSFYADFTGEVEGQMFNLNEDLDLFVLPGCDPSTCLAESSNPYSDDETFTIDVIEGNTYYIVIDGYLGAFSTYYLSLECKTASCKDCGDCFTYTTWNKGITTDITCYPKYVDCRVAEYPSDDHSFQWTVDGVVKSTKYKPTLSLETGVKSKVCQIVKYAGIEAYRCCWDIQPTPGCGKSPVAHVEAQGEWPYYEATLNAGKSENGQRYFWDFGDGTMLQNGGTSPTAGHTFSAGGYTYCVYVQNDYGISTYCKSFSPGAFECTGSENPQFTYTVSGRTLTLKDVSGSAGIITSYHIDYGDSTAVINGTDWMTRSHTFQRDSTYEICVRFTIRVEAGFPFCEYEGCVCFTVRVGCCQQTVDQCYDIRPEFVSGNGGFTYRFKHTTPGIQVLSWEIDDMGIPNSFGNEVTHTFPQAGFYKVCCLYRDPVSGCYIKCCKWVYIGDPFDPADCGGILYTYHPESNGYRFELDRPAGEVEEIQWTVDDPVYQTLGTSLQSNILGVPSGPCREYIVSVRYYDKSCNCYRLCCLRIFLCTPSACANLISSTNLGNGKTRFFADQTYEQMQWYANGQFIGGGVLVDYAVPLSGASICVYYFDPVSRCYRVCCREILTATLAIENLQTAEILPNPASDHLNIYLSFTTPASVGVELISDLGVVVRRIPAENNGSAVFNQRLDIGDLPAGMYLVRIRTSQGEMIRRIIHL